MALKVFQGGSEDNNRNNQRKPKLKRRSPPSSTKPSTPLTNEEGGESSFDATPRRRRKSETRKSSTSKPKSNSEPQTLKSSIQNRLLKRPRKVFLVLAPNGVNPRCEEYSKIDEALAALHEACRQYPASDIRAFMFSGEQLHIPMIDELTVDLKVISSDGQSHAISIPKESDDKSNLKTGIIIKLIDDMIGMSAIDEQDPAGDDFTFL